MDANGLKFWMLADESQWRLGTDSPAQYDRPRRSLRLASERTLTVVHTSDASNAKAIAEERLKLVPQTRDAFGTRAFWDAPTQTVRATGALTHSVPIFQPAAGLQPTDLAVGYDGILYVAIDGRVVMHDLRNRWDDVTLAAADFRAWRLAADPAGGVWVLDRDETGDPLQPKLAHVRGVPLPRQPAEPYAPSTFRPVEENPDPPRLLVLATRWQESERPVAIASDPHGRLAVLNWLDDRARVYCLNEHQEWLLPVELAGVHFPYSLAWVSDEQVAVLLSEVTQESPVYSLHDPELLSDDAGDDDAPRMATPVGDYYPLREHDGGPFVNGVSLPPHYPAGSVGGVAQTRPLRHLSLPAFTKRGHAASSAPLDSGDVQTVWHRVYIEAAIPPHCGIVVRLAASKTLGDEIAADDWHQHRFGEMFTAANSPGVPRGAWLANPSEIPFHQGLIACERAKNRSGLFTVLIQRPGRRVRTLRGRYLHVQVELTGDGRTTPEIWGLRAYASRFSYLNRYLPELYRESLFGPDADAPSTTSTPADFLERFLDNFEGILTPLEDRIAGAYLLTDPRTVPEESLEWLGSWIGLSFDPAYPVERRRQLLAATPQLYRERGTLPGLKRALDVATGGGVRRGQIVVVEDFRLRRTLATILGADLADERDPLLAGLAVSGNSFVGDTLFIGDENKAEFLAVFRPEVAEDAEQAAVQEFLERLAHRVTVLVHQSVEPLDLGLIRRVVELETPAHVITHVATATQPLLVAIASLVGVDTFLSPEAMPQPVRVEHSHVGLRDVIQRPASLDPRLEGGSP